MAMRDVFLAEFDHEMANTRRTLERVPEAKFDWRPHQKSFTMQALASHLANIPAWTEMTLNQDSLDMSPDGETQFQTPQAKSTAELLKFFDENVAAARKAISDTSDEGFQQVWTLLKAGEAVFAMPKAAVLRSFILNHNVHHRAQLTVYLRLNDVPVPAIYGQSADEAGM